MNAVRLVLGEIDALSVPEQLVFNKIDAVDADTLANLRQRHPGALFVSARSGAHLGQLHEIIADRLPRPDVEVQVLLPYTRGDLLAKMHEYGEVLEIAHQASGSAVTARVNPGLAAALGPFLATPAAAGRTLEP
jgi:GTP-binding protein HflX